MKINQKKFEQAVDVFSKYLKEEQAIQDKKEREERKNFFQKLFKEELNEFVFGEIIKKLWASQIWANQEYLVSNIIQKNGWEKIKIEFQKLISKEGTSGKRYEEFLLNIKGMGPSMVTEILCYAEPKNAGIWNDKVRKAFAWLEAEEMPYQKYKISGAEYDLVNNFLKELSLKIAHITNEDVDLLFVNYFLWEIWDKLSQKDEQEIGGVKEKIEKGASRHDEIRDKIAAIGTWLGFEVETEKTIGPGTRVDTVWYARIANLGAVSYVFEVQDKGSRDSLILNLQRAQSNPTVQKLIVVSDNEQLEKIKLEIGNLPENFRNATKFWSFDDVEKSYQNLEQVSAALEKLKLLEE
jgi:hypothetical protein